MISAMTRKEFSEKSETLRKLTGWRLLVLMLVAAGYLFVGPFLFAYIERIYHTNRWDAPGSILLLVLMFGGLIEVTCLEWRLAKKWGLSCPKCGKRFIDKMRGRVLLAGKCPKCKAEVFEDRAISAPLSMRPLNREEFKMEFENFMRRSNRKSIRLLIIGIAAMLGTAPLSEYIQHLVDNGALDWMTLTQWRWFGVAMLASVFLAFFSIFIFAALGKFKLRDLPCPECDRSLVGAAGKLAVETGMCIYCGCRLFEEASSEKAPST